MMLMPGDKDEEASPVLLRQCLRRALQRSGVSSSIAEHNDSEFKSGSRQFAHHFEQLIPG